VNFSPSTLAKIVKMSAKPAFVMKSLLPVSFQLLPSAERTAFVFAASASDPEPGSVRRRRRSSRRSPTRQILLALGLRAEQDDGHRADADVGAEAHGEGPLHGDRLGDEARARLVAVEAAVLFRDVVAQQAHGAGLLHELAHEPGLSSPRCRRAAQHLAAHEIVRRLFHHPLLVVEHLGRETLAEPVARGEIHHRGTA